MKKVLSFKVEMDGENLTGKISDGYHTFDELYDHRITLFIALCRTIQKHFDQETEDDEEAQKDRPVWRSKLHSDGSSFDGWFVLGVYANPSEQITYHLPLSRWVETEFADTLEKAPEFDGHTPQDVLERLKNL